MTPIENKPVKLSPVMQEAIRRIRKGNAYNTFYDVTNGWWICDGDSYKDQTMEALSRRGLIEAGENNGRGLRYYHLTELGKTIKL